MIEIKKGDRYEILYDARDQLFIGLIDGTTVVHDKSQQVVEDYLKKHLKKGFHRIPCFRTMHREIVKGEITSIVRLDSYTHPTFVVWFSYPGTSGPERTKIRLHTETFHEVTPANLVIHENLEALKGQLASLYEKIAQELKALSSPITPANIEALGGRPPQPKEGTSVKTSGGGA